MLGFTKRKDVLRQDTIEGQVRVSTVKKEGPDFGDLKLSQCLQVRCGAILTSLLNFEQLTLSFIVLYWDLLTLTLSPFFPVIPFPLPLRHTTDPSGR